MNDDLKAAYALDRARGFTGSAVEWLQQRRNPPAGSLITIRRDDLRLVIQENYDAHDTGYCSDWTDDVERSIEELTAAVGAEVLPPLTQQQFNLAAGEGDWDCIETDQYSDRMCRLFQNARDYYAELRVAASTEGESE